MQIDHYTNPATKMVPFPHLRFVLIYDLWNRLSDIPVTSLCSQSAGLCRLSEGWWETYCREWNWWNASLESICMILKQNIGKINKSFWFPENVLKEKLSNVIKQSLGRCKCSSCVNRRCPGGPRTTCVHIFRPSLSERHSFWSRPTVHRQLVPELGITFPLNLSRWIPSSTCAHTENWETFFSRNTLIKDDFGSWARSYRNWCQALLADAVFVKKSDSGFHLNMTFPFTIQEETGGLT